MKDIYKKLKETVEKEKLIKENESICLAVSGGPDSVALFYLMKKLRRDFNLKLSVCHYNHQQRGKESDADAEFVKKLANKYKIPFLLGSLAFSRFRSDVIPAKAGIHGSGSNGNLEWIPDTPSGFRNDNKRAGKKLSEDKLRQKRYAFFAKIIRENKIDKIALAHTAGDQVETILFNLFRGSGIRGLSGMDYQKDEYIRPLLDICKKEILQYLKNEKIKYRIDKSNKDISYSRNRIRRKILPQIQKLNPSFKKSLLKESKLIKEQYKLTDLTVREKIRKLLEKKSIDIKIWDKLPSEFQGEILRRMLESKKGPQNPSHAQITELRQILKKNNKNKILGRLKFKRNADRIIIDNIK